MGIFEMKFFMWLASIMPERLCYCVFAHVVARVTTGKYSDTVLPELTVTEALKHYGNDRKFYDGRK